MAEFPQRETERPDRISPPICRVETQAGGMSPIERYEIFRNQKLTVCFDVVEEFV